MKYYLEMFKYCLDFKGLAGRKEFWLAMLFNFIVYSIIFLFALINLTVFAILFLLYFLASFLPVLSITIRRLHDTDRIWFNVLWILLPMIGIVVMVVYLTEKTQFNPEILKKDEEQIIVK